jgi:Flp pilus assembly protein TadG
MRPVRRRRPASVPASGGRQRERGAALVEAAIVIPVLVFILFGIIDFGWVFNDYLSVRQGTREGARQVAVSTTPPAPGQAAPGTAAQWTANGCVTGVNPATDADGYMLVCYVKQRMGLKQSDTRVKITFVRQAGSKPFAAGQGVTVCTQYPAKSLSGFMSPFLSGRILASKVTIRIEQDSTWAGTSVPGNPTYAGVEEAALSSWPASCNAV